MSDIENLEKPKYAETFPGPYARAIFSPDLARFEQIRSQASHSILEIGCGITPRLSWKLGSGDLWVGCDPATSSKEPGFVTIQKGGLRINPNASMVVFSDIAADIPKFKPDVLCTVAPNQKDIADGKIFNDELEPFLDSLKQQHFVVELDTRTHEARGYQREAIRVISTWMTESGFKEAEPDDPILDKFSPNSADLGSQNIHRCFVRRPKKN